MHAGKDPHIQSVYQHKLSKKHAKKVEELGASLRDNLRERDVIEARGADLCSEIEAARISLSEAKAAIAKLEGKHLQPYCEQLGHNLQCTVSWHCAWRVRCRDSQEHLQNSP